MRMEDDLLDVVRDLRPHERVDVQLVAVRRRELVHAADVLDRDTVADEDEAAALVRRLLLGVRAQLRAHLRRDHHQSTAPSISSPVQNGAERDFQPPPPSPATTTAAAGSSPPLRRAACTPPPDR